MEQGSWHIGESYEPTVFSHVFVIYDKTIFRPNTGTVRKLGNVLYCLYAASTCLEIQVSEKYKQNVLLVFCLYLSDSWIPLNPQLSDVIREL
jgi:hypothetical protein